MLNNSTNTQAGTRSASDVNIREVFDKIEDDFWAIKTRNFTNIDFDWLGKVFEDIKYVALKKELEIAELQFSANSDDWIVRYEIDDNGGIQRDQDSGGVRFASVPIAAILNIVIRRKMRTQETNDYLNKRGWGGNATLKGAEGQEDRAFSSEGYGASRKLTGKW